MATQKKPAKSQQIRQNPEHGAQRAALEITISALAISGKLGDIDKARIQIARGLASAVDAQPDNPTLWSQYRAAESELRKETDTHGDPFDQLIAEINAEMGNQKKQTTKKPRG